MNLSDNHVGDEGQWAYRTPIGPKKDPIGPI